MERRPPMPEELHVLRLLAAGYTREEIAAQTHRSLSTVKATIAHLLRDWQASNSPNLVAMAYEDGHLTPGWADTAGVAA